MVAELGGIGLPASCRVVHGINGLRDLPAGSIDVLVVEVFSRTDHRLHDIVALHGRFAEIPLFAMTLSTDGRLVGDCIRAGATGCVPPAGVATAIRRVIRGESAPIPHAAGRTAEPDEVDALDLLHSLREVVFQIDEEGVLLYLNPAWTELSGHAVDSSCGCPLSRFVMEEDRGALEASHRELASGAASSIETTLRLRTRKGGYRWVELRMRTSARFAGGACAVGTMIDITTQRDHEDARARHERYYLSLLENSLDAVVVLDTYGVVLYGSPSLRQMVGFEPEELIGRDVFRLVHPDDVARVRALFEKSITRPDEMQTATYRFTSSAGEWRILESHGRTSVDACGRVVVVVNSRDVTDRQRALDEAMLRRSQLNTLFDVLPAMVWYKDTESRILMLNRLAAESMGRTVEDTQGKSTFDIHPQDADKYRQDDLEVIRSRQPKLGIVETLHNAQGSRRWVKTDKIPVFSDAGDVMGVLVLSQDITEVKEAQDALRRSENLFRTLTSHVPVGIYLTDADGKCLYVNDGWSEITGMPPKDAMGDGWKLALYPDDLPRVWQEWSDSVAARRPFELQDYRFLRPDGEIRWVDGKAVQLRHESGARVGYLGYTVDVTERRRHAAERQRLARKLLEVREKDRAEVSDFLHEDIAQTISSVKLDLEGMASGKSDSRAAAAEAIARIDDVLARIRSKALEQRPPLIDDLEIDAALEFLTDRFSGQCRTRLDLRVLRPIDALGSVTKTCLYRVLQEFLQNVADHSKASSAIVEVRQEASSVHLSVTDDGVGFDREKPRLGAGVGLVGVEEMVRQLGGALMVESPPAGGTRVEVVLPIGEQEGSAS